MFGKKILVTRTRDQASELVNLLEEQGAECLEGATIALVEPENWDELDTALDNLPGYDWLIFTSINAIAFFFRRLAQKNLDARDLKGPKIAVVGIATAEVLRGHGIEADLLPREFTGEGLAEVLLEQGVAGKKILLPRAAKAREILVEKLASGGAEVTVAPVYRNVRPEGYGEVKDALERGEIDVVTFTSSSTVTNFLEMLGCRDRSDIDRLLSGVKVAVIGPITARTAEKSGLKIDIQPETYTIPDLVAAIVDYFDRKQGESG